jgi:tRNA (guanine-N7-)-methyltransferase
MRIRRKKWAEKELDEAPFYINNPEINYKNTWKNRFEKVQPLHIEIGCGKGTFIASLASENENINYIAIDMIEAMLGLSKRSIEEAYGDRKVSNLLLIRANAERILDIFGDEDKIDRIYINFCNPWPKAKHKTIRKLQTFLKARWRNLF